MRGEAQVSNLLKRYGIPFVYEQSTLIYDRGRYRIWHPDFTLPKHRNMIVELRHPDGRRTKGPGNPIKLSRTNEESFSAAPLLGATSAAFDIASPAPTAASMTHISTWPVAKSGTRASKGLPALFAASAS